MGESGQSSERGAPPTIIGRYALFGELAAGGMATVHLGRLMGPGGFSRTVAIKRLHPQFARDPDFVEMLLDEARIAASIVHPNVVPTLDVISEGNEVLLVMEYVHGVSLSQVIRTLRASGERVPLPVAMGIMVALLRGLHAAHEAVDDRGAPLDIVHRDVSPQNVLVGIDGVARVVDFGVAKAAGRLHTTQDGRIKGKLTYMAPEQLCQGTITRRTDVYAASIVMWELVTGQRLFGGDTGEGLINRVLLADAPAPSTVISELAPEVDEITMRGLDREPSRRFATALEMAEAIEQRLEVAGTPRIAEWLRSAAAGPLQTHADRKAEIERSRPVEAGEATGHASEVVAEIPTLGASVTGSIRTEPSRRLDRTMIAVGAGAIAIVAALGIASLRYRAGTDVATPSTAVASPPVDVLADAAAAAASGAPTLPMTSASARPVATTAPARQRHAPAPAASGKACPPFKIDAQGHKVFNAACL